MKRFFPFFQSFSAPVALFHVTHWKAGSQWINKILQACAPERIVQPQLHETQFLQQPIRPGYIYPTVYVTRAQFESVQISKPWRRFIIIRDLRDTLVSGYFSIRYSHSLISQELADWRNAISQLSEEEGLLYIMREWLGPNVEIQQSWLGGPDPILHYEDLLKNDIELLENAIWKNGRLPLSREVFDNIVIANRFENLTHGRAPGQEDVHVHERKGISGDWRNHFTRPMIESFKEQYGRLLIQTGYENNNNW